MINNLHIIERIIRIIIGVVIAIFYFNGLITGLAATILGLIAIVAIVTGLIGYCPIYHLLGISTKDWGKKK